MNLFVSSFIVKMTTLMLPTLTSTNNIHKVSYPVYLKSLTSLSFLLSLIPTSVFLNSNHEAEVSTWNRLTIQTLHLNKL